MRSLDFLRQGSEPSSALKTFGVRESKLHSDGLLLTMLLRSLCNFLSETNGPEPGPTRVKCKAVGKHVTGSVGRPNK